MVHFLFYAGRAYNYKQDEPEYNSFLYAISDGGMQEEVFDFFAAKHSRYSYEDLPSDLEGAYFGAYIFDKNSDKTFEEQVISYLGTLNPIDPKSAPNYMYIPNTHDDLGDSPTWVNKN